MPTTKRFDVSQWVPPAVLLVGAGAYATAQTVLGWTFLDTPLFVGVVVVLAAVLGRTRRLIPNGLVLVGWGLGVLAAGCVLPAGREAPAYLLGAALGVGAARLVSRPEERSRWFGAAAATATASGALFLLAYDVRPLDGWPAWAISLVIWAGVEAIRVARPADRHHEASP